MVIDPAPSELIAIIRRGHESRELDYKAASAWSEKNKKACCELVKDILAMANTTGGMIAIGVSEASTGFVWDGMSEEQAASYDTSRINRFLQEYADPPINALLRKVAHEGKIFVIIEVPQFPETPHICQKDFPDVLRATTLYVRTHNNESAPISSPADFRLIIDQAVRNRSDQLLVAVRSIMIGTPPSGENRPAKQAFMDERVSAIEKFSKLNNLDPRTYNFFFEASFFPDDFTQKRYSIEQLRAAAYRAHIDFTGWPFLFIHVNRPDLTHVVENGLETFVSDTYFNGYPLLDYWRFNESGFFFHRRLSPGDGGDKPLADMGFTVAYIAEAIDCLMRLYTELIAEDHAISFMLRLLGTDNRQLTRLPPHMPLWQGHKSVIPEITVERRKALAEWRAGLQDHAVDICKEVFLRFNWIDANLELTRQMIQKLFTRSW
jgi:hypothetical protein